MCTSGARDGTGLASWWNQKWITEGDGVDGEEEEIEAGVLAALGWFQNREGKDFMPLEGKEQRIREKKQPEEPENMAPVLYIG